MLSIVAQLQPVFHVPFSKFVQCCNFIRKKWRSECRIHWIEWFEIPCFPIFWFTGAVLDGQSWSLHILWGSDTLFLVQNWISLFEPLRQSVYNVFTRRLPDSKMHMKTSSHCSSTLCLYKTPQVFLDAECMLSSLETAFIHAWLS